MITNDSNRAPLKKRLLNAVFSALFFTLFFEFYDIFLKEESFDFVITVITFVFVFLLFLGVNYLILKNKQEK